MRTFTKLFSGAFVWLGHYCRRVCLNRCSALQAAKAASEQKKTKAPIVIVLESGQHARTVMNLPPSLDETMKRKQFTKEQIIETLREQEAEMQPSYAKASEGNLHSLRERRLVPAA